MKQNIAYQNIYAEDIYLMDKQDKWFPFLQFFLFFFLLLLIPLLSLIVSQV